MATDHFGFTKLIVGDLERSADFYKSVCELTESGRVDATIEGRRISEIMFNATGQGAATFVLLTYPDDPIHLRYVQSGFEMVAIKGM